MSRERRIVWAGIFFQRPPILMLVGFSLSPGGLLLPYHLGILASLDHHGHINSFTPLAGSSAGAIAVASHASGVSPHRALEASIRVSAHCYNPFFVPAGKLMGALRHEMDALLHDEAHHVINERQGLTVLAHRELYPQPKSRLVTQFDTRQCLMDAVCDSSMFPFFTSNKIARAVRRRNEMVPRVVVDGIFAVSPERLGCPDFDEVEYDGKERYVVKRGKMKEGEKPDRTVLVASFPKELLSLSTSNAKYDVIGPRLNLENPIGHAAGLVKMACLASNRKDLVNLYEQGWQDAEDWTRKEERRNALAGKVEGDN